MAVQTALIHIKGHGMLLRLCVASTDKLTGLRPRSARGRKEVGMIGQASWISSIINLVNTSKRRAKVDGAQILTLVQSSVPAFSLCP